MPLARLPPQWHLIIRHSFEFRYSDFVILQRARCRHVFSLMPVWFPRKNQLEHPRCALPSGSARVERIVLNALVPAKVERSPRRLLSALVPQLRDGFAA